MTDRPRSIDASDLVKHYRAVRTMTESLCETLEPEDFVVQAMPDASPAKWHLAHTSWFFETFVLKTLNPNHRPIREDANFLFNSYYNAVGERIARDRRGLLSRPSIKEIFAYRRDVDRQVLEALNSIDLQSLNEIHSVVTLGLNHEQQHQELLLTDIKAAFGANPIRPVFRPENPHDSSIASPRHWIPNDGGLCEIGHSGSGFAFDNEGPRHRVFVEPFEFATRLSTNADYLAFMDAGGYARPEFWLSDGWGAKTKEGWTTPLYWEKRPNGYSVFTLHGMRPLDPNEPVTHLSFYEADAFARWSGARLPTEAEWEVASAGHPIAGNFLESGSLHPIQANPSGVSQIFGDTWEWTSSPYVAYPRYRPASGALGEYNGKFMCNQIVLRGGSCATPISHVRATYRNFFGAGTRWQFSGARLARSIEA